MNFSPPLVTPSSALTCAARRVGRNHPHPWSATDLTDPRPGPNGLTQQPWSNGAKSAASATHTATTAEMLGACDIRRHLRAGALQRVSDVYTRHRFPAACPTSSCHAMG
ncbi:MAG: hypothetical protein IPJ47_18675 [Anaerolineales bacterium]|nr:hypothetical protein [Anaerolineales bacterium]